jgi:molybdate transport system substrate-binding protein
MPGTTYVGPIPAELDRNSAYAAAVTTKANEPEAAMALIKLLASPEAEAIILKRGLTLPIRNPTQ